MSTMYWQIIDVDMDKKQVTLKEVYDDRERVKAPRILQISDQPYFYQYANKAFDYRDLTENDYVLPEYKKEIPEYYHGSIMELVWTELDSFGRIQDFYFFSEGLLTTYGNHEATYELDEEREIFQELFEERYNESFFSYLNTKGWPGQEVVNELEVKAHWIRVRKEEEEERKEKIRTYEKEDEDLPF